MYIHKTLSVPLYTKFYQYSQKFTVKKFYASVKNGYPQST